MATNDAEIGAFRSVPTWLRVHFVAVTLVVILAVSRGLDRSLWRDEVASANVTVRPFGSLAHLFSNAEAGMFGYMTFLHRWVAVAGSSETALRLPSLAAAAVTMIAAGVLTFRLAGTVAAVCVPIALAVHPRLITFYGIETRGYMAAVAFVTLAALFAHRVSLTSTSNTSSRWAIVCWGLTAGAAVICHFLAVLAVAPQLLWLARARAMNTRIVLRSALVIVGVVAVVTAFATRHNNANSWIGPFTVEKAASTTAGNTTVAGALLFIAAVVVLVALRQVDDNQVARSSMQTVDWWVVGSWAMLPTAALVSASIVGIPALLPRYALASVVGWTILVTVVVIAAVRTIRAGLPSTPRRLARVGSVVILVVAGAGVAYECVHFGLLQPHRPDEDPRATAAWITGHQRPGDGVFYKNPFVGESIRWYLVYRTSSDPPLDVMLRDDVSAADSGSRTPPPRTPDSTPAAVASIDRLFVVLPDRSTPSLSPEHARILAEVERCWTLVDEVGGTFGVQLWTRPEQGCSV